MLYNRMHSSINAHQIKGHINDSDIWYQIGCGCHIYNLERGDAEVKTAQDWTTIELEIDTITANILVYDAPTI